MDNYKRRLIAIRKARKREMADMIRRKQWTFQQAADFYGLTRQRIHQIVKGVYGTD